MIKTMTITIPSIPSIPSISIPTIPSIPIPSIPSIPIPTTPAIPIPTIPAIPIPTIPSVSIPTITIPTPSAALKASNDKALRGVRSSLTWIYVGSAFGGLIGLCCLICCLCLLCKLDWSKPCKAAENCGEAALRMVKSCCSNLKHRKVAQPPRRVAGVQGESQPNHTITIHFHDQKARKDEKNKEDQKKKEARNETTHFWDQDARKERTKEGKGKSEGKKGGKKGNMKGGKKGGKKGDKKGGKKGEKKEPPAYQLPDDKLSDAKLLDDKLPAYQPPACQPPAYQLASQLPPDQAPGDDQLHTNEPPTDQLHTNELLAAQLQTNEADDTEQVDDDELLGDADDNDQPPGAADDELPVNVDHQLPNDDDDDDDDDELPAADDQPGDHDDHQDDQPADDDQQDDQPADEQDDHPADEQDDQPADDDDDQPADDDDDDDDDQLPADDEIPVSESRVLLGLNTARRVIEQLTIHSQKRKDLLSKLDKKNFQIDLVQDSLPRQTSVEKNRNQIPTVERTQIKIDRVLDQGNFGTVLKCVWECDNKPQAAALKIPKKLIVGAEKEAEVWASCPPHPNVARMLARVEDKEKFYGVLIEYFDQGDLSTKQSFSSEDVLDIARQITRGLAHLNQVQIVHRDLAPRNVLLMSGGRVAITDFGLSRFLDPEYYATGNVLQMPWRIFAPELMSHYPPPKGKTLKYDWKTDVWALGVTLWELCTKKKPYGDQTMDEVKSSKNWEFDLKPLAEKYIYLLPMIAACLQQNPKHRPTPKEAFILLRDSESLEAWEQ